jgi:predicted transcriptional regulator of viral defense system
MHKYLEILKSKVKSGVFTDTDLIALIPRSANARYGIVKRALKNGDILKLRRGVYAFAPINQTAVLDLFYIAQKLYPPSYVSLESALSYHQMIPEAAYTISSVCSKRSVDFDTPVGKFSFERIPKFNFIGVNRLTSGNAVFLMACPTKALLDLVYCHKIEKVSVRELFSSLRIDPDSLSKLSRSLVKEIADSYANTRVSGFAKNLMKEFVI